MTDEEQKTPEVTHEVTPEPVKDDGLTTEELKHMLSDLKEQQNNLMKELQARHATPEETPKPAAADWSTLFGGYIP